MNKKPAVFLDRDGTICKEKGYLNRESDIELIPGAAAAIRRINLAGWKVVVISNQSGVARGYFSEKIVQEINSALVQILKNMNAFINGIYYCPHYPQGNPPYNIECKCRKPAPGLILKAGQELNIDISRSVVIGDKYTDILTAQNLNIPGILVLTGYGKEELQKHENEWKIPPAFTADNLLSAVEWWFLQVNAQD